MVKSSIQVRSCRLVVLAIGSLVLTGLTGCGSAPRVDQPDSIALGTLRVTHHEGGTVRGILLADDVWYITRGTTILTLDPDDLSVLGTRSLGRVGAVGPIADLAWHGRDLNVVLQDTALVRLRPAAPESGGGGGPLEIIEIRDAEELGILPRHIGTAGDRLYVSGHGGVVRVEDGALVLMARQEAGPVVATAQGPVTTLGRRLHALADDRYLGSASGMAILPDDTALPAPFAFFRRGRDGPDSVGLMNERFRDVNAERTTVAVETPIRRLRVIDDRIWLVTAEDVRSYAYVDGALALDSMIGLAGAWDLAGVGGERLVVVGAFGCVVFERADGPGRWREAGRWSTAGPGTLDWAASRGGVVMVGGSGGTWSFSPQRGTVRPAPTRPPVEAPVQREALTIWSRARLDDAGARLVITAGDAEVEYTAPGDATMRAVVAVGGRIWVAHERGIVVLSGRLPRVHQELATINLEGPVLYLFPLNSGEGAVYVSGDGGVGVVEMTEPETDSSV